MCTNRWTVLALLISILPCSVVTAAPTKGTSLSPVPFSTQFIAVPTGITYVFSGEVKKGQKYALDITRKGDKHIEASKLVIMTNQGEKFIPMKSHLISENNDTFKVQRTFIASSTGRVYYRAHFWSGAEFKKKYSSKEKLGLAYKNKDITKGATQVKVSSAQLKRNYDSYSNPPKKVSMAISLRTL